MKVWAAVGCWAVGLAAHAAAGGYRDFSQPPHEYFQRAPSDRFTSLKGDLEAGRLALNPTDEKTFLRSLLEVLGIPATSQLLVFSTTSLQLSRITPSNPRALYFSEDLYLGFIPGGRLELAALDPDLGPVFYIFDIPRGSEPVRAERATRCMNCHAGEDTGYVPGLVVKSVIPGPSGGSLDAFRVGEFGHGIPFAQRFGGWYVTGQGDLTNHWGNTIGRSVDGEMTRIPTPPEGRVAFERYLLPTSSMLAHLIHEHQVGFVNRVVGATYRARSFLASDGGERALTPEHLKELDEQAETVVRYLLFVDEIPLPTGGIVSDPAFAADFLKGRREVGGQSLKDLDLKKRLFRHRCSYMIYSSLFLGMPGPIKARIYHHLDVALRDGRMGESRVEVGIPSDERQAIRRILKSTLPDLPADW